MGGVSEARTDRVQGLANAQRAWLDHVVITTGRTLSEVARAAKVNPSTLTRFRNSQDRVGVLSATTMAAVSMVSGVPLPQDVHAPAPAAGAALRGFGESEAALWEGEPTDPVSGALRAMTGSALHLVPWVLRSNALLHEGFRPGDILIVDLNAEPKPGNIVLAQLYDWQNPRGTETVLRLYEPPYLIASGPVEAAKRPELIDQKRVVIKGVMQAMLRRSATPSG